MSEPGFDMPACLELVRTGDEEAARRLFEHLRPLVLKVVRAHLPRRISEEDLAQTIFMKVFSNLDQYSARAPFEHWVSRIAVNTCIKALRAERARPELRRADLGEDEAHVLDLLATTSDDLGPDQSVASRELVEKLLARLSPEHRLAVNLLHLEGRSVEEVKALTGWNESVIKVRAFRARRKLRRFLDELMKERRT
jgi:RNA polymerase sigma-70 factor (ECF subfamily)